ncbi:hypothetical protein JCM33774_27940 [Actinophytocola sp. KF-1]
MRGGSRLAILRGDLAVGVTGDMPRYVLSQLVARRAAPVPDLLDWMTTIPYAGFVIAGLDPAPQLWKVGDGRVEDRTSVGRARAGDSASYEHFQARWRSSSGMRNPGSPSRSRPGRLARSSTGRRTTTKRCPTPRMGSRPNGETSWPSRHPDLRVLGGHRYVTT